jgi:hypothetical protein
MLRGWRRGRILQELRAAGARSSRERGPIHQAAAPRPGPAIRPQEQTRITRRTIHTAPARNATDRAVLRLRRGLTKRLQYRSWGASPPHRGRAVSLCSAAPLPPSHRATVPPAPSGGIASIEPSNTSIAPAVQFASRGSGDAVASHWASERPLAARKPVYHSQSFASSRAP